MDIAGLRTAIHNAREAGVAREMVQKAVAELDRAQAKYTQERKERSQRELRAPAMPGRLSRFGAEHIDRLRIAVHDAQSCGVEK